MSPATGQAIMRPRVGTTGADWQWLAACRLDDPDLFYPADLKSRAGAAQVERARAVCRGCAVWDLCLLAALRGDEHGVWGGLTRPDRDALLKAAGDSPDRAVDIARARREAR